MPRKIKTVEVNETQSFTVKELNMRKIWQLQSDDTLKEMPDMDKAKHLMREACPELTTDHFMDLYPSELKQLWDAFEEVNRDFLSVVRMMGLDKIILAAMTEALSASMTQFASSSPTGTVQ